MTFTAQYANAEQTSVTRSDMPSASIPVDPGNRHYAEIVDAGVAIAAYVPPAPTTDDVTAHAESLIEQGVVVNVTGIAEPIYVQGRDKDTRNVQGLVTAAQLRLASGDTTTLTAFRDGNNVTHQLTPAQVIEMWQLSAGYITAVYAASWSIKADDPIGDDFRDDARWPDNGLS
jgi:hypothetical protein